MDTAAKYGIALHIEIDPLALECLRDFLTVCGDTFPKNSPLDRATRAIERCYRSSRSIVSARRTQNAAK